MPVLDIPPPPVRGSACLDPVLDAWSLDAARIVAERSEAQEAIREAVRRLREPRRLSPAHRAKISRACRAAFARKRAAKETRAGGVPR